MGVFIKDRWLDNKNVLFAVRKELYFRTQPWRYLRKEV